MRSRASGRPRVAVLLLVVLALLALLALLAGCGKTQQGSKPDPDQVDSTDAPESLACRMLTPNDVELPSNATTTVPCSEPHTAQTFRVSTVPEDLTDLDYDAPELGAFAYRDCGAAFMAFTGGDESQVMRSVVSWAWFRPSQAAWDDGARWFRCDIVGGGPQSASYVLLPVSAEGLLHGQPDDDWLACAQGDDFAGSTKVPCSTKHEWRAVTTIKLGEPDDPYPGDKVSEVRTRDYCSDSVGAWLSYPVEYDFAYTWFHQAEWEAGNRRSVCWAKTDQ